WEHIGDKHTLAFDFSKIEESKRGEVFNILFPAYDSKTAQFFPQLDLRRIYELSPFFSQEHWKHIGDKHTLAFDFSKIEESKREEVVNILFSAYDSKAARLLPKLTPSQFEIVRPYLSPYTLKYIK
ncbi:MAG: hypothetical protein K1000chlam4_01084, partial [Chlamydiae bacterium]|nr:hypothetical protein [Chlamydiota bacterium]